MTEILTFGELCEAIIENKDIQVQSEPYNTQWTTAIFIDAMELSMAYKHFNHNTYRIKPQTVYKYQWLIKEPDGKYFLTTHKETESEAKYHYGDMIVEPYLPSKEPV